MSTEEEPRPARAYAWVDRRLKALILVVPVVIVLAMQVGISLIEGERLGTLLEPDQAVFLLLTVLLVLGFGWFLIRLIDRAQAHVVRQNHQLAATNAVTQAVQGQLTAEAIADHALTHVLTASGAREATIIVRPGPEVGSRELVRTLRADPVAGDPLVAEVADRVVEVPLHGSRGDVGRLRLIVPGSVPAEDVLALGTLRTIGHQVAMAVELSHFVGDLHRRQDEGHAFYDVLLQIGGQVSPLLVLSTITQYARDLVAADAAVVLLDDEVVRLLDLVGNGAGSARSWVASGLGVVADPHNGQSDDSVSRSAVEGLLAEEHWGATAAAPINGPHGPLGTLWVGRSRSRPLGARGRGFLMTLAELASIALTSAQQREVSLSRSVVEERERIAREMHDSLAQVLGVTHLRLRALEVAPDLPEAARTEVTALAEICADAYTDVREGILGLRSEHAGRREFEDSLCTFLRRWTEQSGVPTAYDNRLGVPLALSPRSEVQLLRVVQEALANVRKHAHASSAIVRVEHGSSDGPLGTPSVVISVIDDGQGFVGAGRPEVGSGFGMVTMHDRLALLGGTLTVTSGPGEGTMVVATVPEAPRSQVTS